MTYGDLQLQGKVLRDKAFNISKSLKYGGYEHDLAWMFINVLVKTFLVVLLHVYGQSP